MLEEIGFTEHKEDEEWLLVKKGSGYEVVIDIDNETVDIEFQFDAPTYYLREVFTIVEVLNNLKGFERFIKNMTEECKLINLAVTMNGWVNGVLIYPSDYCSSVVDIDRYMLVSNGEKDLIKMILDFSGEYLVIYSPIHSKSD